MNMLVFDPIRAMSHYFLRVSPYFAVPPKLHKKREAVVRLVREERAKKPNRRKVTGKINHKLEEEVISKELLQLGNIYSIDV